MSLPWWVPDQGMVPSTVLIFKLFQHLLLDLQYIQFLFADTLKLNYSLNNEIFHQTSFGLQNWILSMHVCVHMRYWSCSELDADLHRTQSIFAAWLLQIRCRSTTNNLPCKYVFAADLLQKLLCKLIYLLRVCCKLSGSTFVIQLTNVMLRAHHIIYIITQQILKNICYIHTCNSSHTFSLLS